MSGQEFNRILADDLAQRRAAHQYRQRRCVRPIDSTHVELDGHTYVNFSSNNYLGLTHHPRLLAAGTRGLQQCGAGSGAAGLISGYSPVQASAERTLARWKGTEAAVLLPSGYQANLAAVQTLGRIADLRLPIGDLETPPIANPPLRFLMDKLVHASLVDAVRGTGAPFRVFPHNQLAKLGRLLTESADGQLQVVVTESIFSMDGDACDLAGLAELKRRHSFVLLLDEAHASGVYGPGGSGLAAELGLQNIVDVSVVTLSKGLGCMGGAVCGSAAFCDSLVNHGRAYIYSTEISPVLAACADEAVQVLADEAQRRERVRTLARMVREELGGGAVAMPAGDSPIIPVIVGAEQDALFAAEQMQERGLLVMAVRPPTVPRGSSRLRITLSSDHTDQEIAHLIGSVRELFRSSTPG